ncbi:MAG TPA: response regulator transcription factor [Candidatus Xenobia bacterium]|jgi:two-component system nitrate/nitrite response regulator NarL
MTVPETQQQKIKVMLVDDHNLFREGVSSMLAMTDNIEIVAELSHGQDAVSRAVEVDPDIVLLDLHLPQISGIEICRALLKERPKTKVVMLTISKDLPSLYEAMKAGACGYLIKDIKFNELVDALEKVYTHGGLPESLSGEMVQHMHQMTEEERRNIQQRTALGKLSPRELEILKQITEGKGNREIAVELTISEHTVRNHINNIFNKLQVKDRTEAAVLAIRHGVA